MLHSVRATTHIYLTATEAARLAGEEAYEIDALAEAGALDSREHDGVLYISRVSLRDYIAEKQRGLAVVR